MNKLKVGFISHFSSLQMGGQRSTFHLMENINREKFEPVLICPEKGEFSEQCARIGITSYFLDLYSVKPKHYIKLFKEVSILRKMINDLDMDILHVDRDADVFITNIAKRRTKAKSVWHIRVNGKNFFDGFNSRNSDGIIGVSDAAKNRVSIKYLDKYKTIYNGVDLSLFQPAKEQSKIRHKLKLPVDKFILIFVGQLKEGKGIFDIIEALNILKKKVSELPLTLFIGTFQSDGIKQKLMNLIKTYNLNNVCRIIPQQNNIHEWMQAADALLIPSYPGVEGMPRVLYEAMACGCIGIGSNTEGIKEVIDERYGLLVEAGNPLDISKNIEILIKDKDLQSDLKIKGRQRAEELFDIKRHTREVEKFYLESLNRNG